MHEYEGMFDNFLLNILYRKRIKLIMDSWAVLDRR